MTEALTHFDNAAAKIVAASDDLREAAAELSVAIAAEPEGANREAMEKLHADALAANDLIAGRK